MSILKNKSDNNFKAAEFLINESYYSSSVHCSYYSCLQLVKHIIMNIYNKSEDDIYRNVQTERKNSHEYLIEFLRKQLLDKTQIIASRDYNNWFGQLKILRVESDYKEIDIEEDKSKKAKDYSEKILTILNKHFL